MKEPNIKIEREIRQCQHNAEIQHGGNGKLIYDFGVTIDGERRATFSRKMGKAGYDLQTAGAHIEMLYFPQNGNFGKRALQVPAKDCFESSIKRWLDDGLIPTVAEIQAKKTDVDAKKQKALDDEKAWVRTKQIKDAAPDLLEALQAVVANSFYAASTGYQHLEAGIMTLVHAAIAKATQP